MMKLVNLEIARPHSYSGESVNPLFGNVKLCEYTEGTNRRINEMNVELTPETIGKIINLIAVDVARQANANAKKIGEGMKQSAMPILENAPDMVTIGN
jgi:hypothetical protein